VRCGLPSLNLAVPRFPTRKSDYDRLLAFNRALARSCQKRTGAYLMHVAAVDVVRDMEGIREVLRDGKLIWLGLSYGTMLGGLYAERYPAQIRAMVLDGALDRALYEPVMLADEARAGEAVLRDWSRLIAGANRTPIPNPGVPSGVTGGDIQSATDENLLLFKQPNPFTPLNWRVLGQAVRAALGGDASPFAPVIAPPPLSGGRAIGCLDFPVQARGYKGFVARVNAARRPPCAERAIDRYLIDLVLPRAGAVCHN
jgi:pimeloyl-ACP methyl ester carboxylesterase